MIFDLSKDIDLQRFKAKVKVLVERKSRIELIEKSYRTPNQNRYLHLLLGVVAMETGNTLEYVKEYYFKRLVNADIFVVDKLDRFTGKMQITRSSASITKEQMSLAIDRLKKWGANEGIYLPDSTNEQALAEIEREMSRYRGYL